MILIDALSHAANDAKAPAISMPLKRPLPAAGGRIDEPLAAYQQSCRFGTMRMTRYGIPDFGVKILFHQIALDDISIDCLAIAPPIEELLQYSITRASRHEPCIVGV